MDKSEKQFRLSQSAKWELPVFFNNDQLAGELLSICANANIKKPFEIAYGAPRSAWSGGRPPRILHELTESEVHDYFSLYKRHNVTCYYTFSKYNISCSDLANPYCNMLLNVASQYGGGVIVSNDLLRQYIKEKYPEMPIIASVIKPTFETEYKETHEYYINLLNAYDYVVPLPEFLTELDHAKQLCEYAEHIIVLANQTCLKKCPHAQNHYSFYEDEANLQKGNFFAAPCRRDKLNINSFQNRIHFSINHLNKLENIGFTNFKLQGRNLDPEGILEYIGNYIFEPTGVFMDIKHILLNRINK